MEESKQSKQTPAKLPVDFRRDPEDFAVRYANNAAFESTIWDIKITFGQTDISLGPNVVIQHTAITIPWPYAKVLSYLLQSQIAAREAEDGHIPFPKNILVPPLDKIPDETAATFKHPDEQVAAVQKVWKAFVADNPELKS
jgi:hypothetical protein